jgi:hypothetical protein
VHAIMCFYFCLNIFSVVLCNISVNQQSFLKIKYLVQLERAIPVVKSLLFLPSRFIHASADRTLQEVNIYEQRKYEVQHLLKKMPWFLKPATCSYKFSFIYTFRLGYYHFIFRKLANHQCLLWWILNICFLKSFAD